MQLHNSSFGVVPYMGMPQRPVSGREPGCHKHHVASGLPCAPRAARSVTYRLENTNG